MIDAVTRIIDKLTELLQIREQSKERYFRNFVEPLFQDAEKVADDYIALFTELVLKLKQQESVPEVIEWIEGRKRELLPVRIKLRGTLNILYADTTEMNKFEHGMWWLLRGGLSFTEEGYVQLNDDDHFGEHTVLDLLYGLSQEPLSTNRKHFLKGASLQLQCVEKAWHEITEGYAEVKKQALA